MDSLFWEYFGYFLYVIGVTFKCSRRILWCLSFHFQCNITAEPLKRFLFVYVCILLNMTICKNHRIKSVTCVWCIVNVVSVFIEIKTRKNSLFDSNLMSFFFLPLKIYTSSFPLAFHFPHLKPSNQRLLSLFHILYSAILFNFIEHCSHGY